MKNIGFMQIEPVVPILMRKGNIPSHSPESPSVGASPLRDGRRGITPLVGIVDKRNTAIQTADVPVQA
jgi:hypothetical protein